MRGMFTMITRSGNSAMRQIHNSGDNAFRMPLFLSNELELKWLSPDLADEEIREILDYEIPSDALDYWPVFSIRGKQVRPDGKLKTEKFDYPDLPPLGDDEPQKELF